MTDKLPETLPVELTLEESGMLCHFMMGNEDFFKAAQKGKTTDPFMRRMFKLYEKLTDTNDKLMGKKPL